MTRERKIRRAQTVSPGGVGAVVDLLGESLVGMDTSRWNVMRVPIRAPRIAAHLGVSELRMPPASDSKSRGLPYFRFPAWLFCGTCRRMVRWSANDEVVGEAPQCESCKKRPRLIPMRFVVVCGNGHLDDVDWIWWAHSGAKSRAAVQCGSPRLRFESVRGAGGGLRSVRVRCTTCEASRALEGIASPDALSSRKCRGGQPWQFANQRETCDADPIVVQRGAASVYFAAVQSAIDIPPDSDWIVWGADNSRVQNNEFFKALQAQPDSPMRGQLIPIIAQQAGVSEQTVIALLDQVFQDDLGGADPVDLADGEWQALCAPNPAPHPRDNFIARIMPAIAVQPSSTLSSVADQVCQLLDEVVMVERLREIRALTGFHRHTMLRKVPPDLGRGVDFLPAIEVFGEGVFLRLNEQAVAQWEGQSDVKARARVLQTRLAGSMRARWLPKATPRRIMLHTLAHLLLREMSFDAGYSASSLRERVYSTAESGLPMAGILVYTAAGDSEGSMGGLARLSQPERLFPILVATMSKAEWCSLDPVCSEATAQGPEGLSLAACHACSLVPETSCDHGNVLLDRALLMHPTYGLLRDAISALHRSYGQGAV